jgi:hypothetical protein
VKYLQGFVWFLAGVLIVFQIIVELNGSRQTPKVMVEQISPQTTLVKGGNITITSGSTVDLWEYKSNNLNCLISLHVYPGRDNSITQISCK